MLPLGSGVGLDIEQQKNTFDQEFLTLAFSPEEQQHLVGGPDRILCCWCAKEASAKLVGLGMLNSPKDLVVVHYEELVGSVRQHVAELKTKINEGDYLKIQVNIQKNEKLVVATTVMARGLNTNEGLK
jgi:phosphopantetheinyl transferase